MMQTISTSGIYWIAMKNTHNSQERLDYLKQQLPLEITRAVEDTLKEDLGALLIPQQT